MSFELKFDDKEETPNESPELKLADEEETPNEDLTSTLPHTDPDSRGNNDDEVNTEIDDENHMLEALEFTETNHIEKTKLENGKVLKAEEFDSNSGPHKTPLSSINEDSEEEDEETIL